MNNRDDVIEAGLDAGEQGLRMAHLLFHSTEKNGPEHCKAPMFADKWNALVAARDALNNPEPEMVDVWLSCGDVLVVHPASSVFDYPECPEGHLNVTVTSVMPAATGKSKLAASLNAALLHSAPAFDPEDELTRDCG